jgi:hypothetical protein
MKDGIQQRIDAKISYLGSRCLDDGSSERFSDTHECVECTNYTGSLKRLQKEPALPSDKKSIKPNRRSTMNAQYLDKIKQMRLDGKTWLQISHILNITTQRASNIFSRHKRDIVK